MDDLSRISPQAVITLFVLLLLFIALIPLIQADISTETADAGAAVEVVATFESGGSYATTQSNDNSYFYGGSDNNNNNFRGYLELYYDISSLGISPGDINSLNFNVTYCHSGDTAPPNCSGNTPEGTANNPQDVEIYSFTSSSWVDIGDLSQPTQGTELTDSFTVSSGFSDYVNSSNWVRFRVESDYSNGMWDDSWLLIDYAPLVVNYAVASTVQGAVKDGYGSALSVDWTVYDTDGTTVLNSSTGTSAFNAEVPLNGYIKYDATTSKNVSARFRVNGSTTNAIVYFDDYGGSNPESVSLDNSIKFGNVSEFNMSYSEVQIELVYSDSELGGLDESKLSIYHFKGGSWQQLSTTRDAVNNRLTATATSLSTFAAAEGVSFTAKVYVRDTKGNGDPSDDALVASASLADLVATGTVYDFGNIGTIYNGTTYVVELQITPNATYEFDADYRKETFFKANNPFALTDTARKEYLVNTSLVPTDGTRTEDIFINQTHETNYSIDASAAEVGVIRGDLDIISGSSDNLVRWHNNTAGDGASWTTNTAYTDGTDIYGVAVGDIDADGYLDVVSVNSIGDDVRLHLNDGDGTFTTSFIYQTMGDTVRKVAVGDVDSDGDLDVITIRDVNTGDEVYWHNNTAGDGSSWTRVGIGALAGDPYALAVGDIDGDGDLDVVTGDLANDVYWWNNTAGDGSSWTAEAIDTTFTTDVYSVAVGDVDNDGDLDVVSGVASVSGDDFFWHNNTAGDGSSWTTSGVGLAGGDANSVAVGDVDGDGAVDIIGGSSNTSIFLFKNTAGDGSTWNSVAIDNMPTAVESVAVGDIDSDGDLDIVSGIASTASTFGGCAGCDAFWHNNTAGGGSSWQTIGVANLGGTGWSVAVGDIDNDANSNILDYYFNASEGAEDGVGSFTGWDNLTANQNYSFYFIMQPDNDWTDGDSDTITFYLGHEASVWGSMTEPKIYGAVRTPFRVKWTWGINTTRALNVAIVSPAPGSYCESDPVNTNFSVSDASSVLLPGIDNAFINWSDGSVDSKSGGQITDQGDGYYNGSHTYSVSTFTTFQITATGQNAGYANGSDSVDINIYDSAETLTSLSDPLDGSTVNINEVAAIRGNAYDGCTPVTCTGCVTLNVSYNGTSISGFPQTLDATNGTFTSSFTPTLYGDFLINATYSNINDVATVTSAPPSPTQLKLVTNRYVVLDDPMYRETPGGIPMCISGSPPWGTDYWNGEHTTIRAYALLLDDGGTPREGINITFNLTNPNGTSINLNSSLTDSTGLANYSFYINYPTVMGDNTEGGYTITATNSTYSLSQDTSFLYMGMGCGYCHGNPTMSNIGWSGNAKSPYSVDTSGEMFQMHQNPSVSAHDNLIESEDCTYCHRNYGTPSDELTGAFTKPTTDGVNNNVPEYPWGIHSNATGSGVVCWKCHFGSDGNVIAPSSPMIPSCFNATMCHGNTSGLLTVPKNTNVSAINTLSGTKTIYSDTFPATGKPLRAHTSGVYWYPDLWERTADEPAPVDFTSGLNSTANTFGPGAGDDGWDWEDSTYGVSGGPPASLVTHGDPSGSSDYTSTGRVEVKVGGTGTGTTSYIASGAWGVQFNITSDEYSKIQGGATAYVSFDWTADDLDGDLEEGAWIKARFGNTTAMTYLGSDLDNGQAYSDATNEIWASVDNPTSGFSPDPTTGTFEYDVTSLINAAGWYYLDFGGKVDWLDASSNGKGDAEGLGAYFDNIELKIVESEKAVLCIICHDPMHNIKKPGLSVGASENSTYSNSWTEDFFCKGCHLDKTQHNNYVNCTLCHTQNLHSISFFNDTGDFIKNKSQAGDCQTCHQNGLSKFNTIKTDSNVTYTGGDPPQIPASFNHSNDTIAGTKWNQTQNGYNGLWNVSNPRSNLNACYYCHGNTKHNQTALGRVTEAYSGTNNTLNGTINSTSKWCGACHYPGNANFTNMQNRFTTDGWEKPPDSTNEAWNSNFFNHSSILTRIDSDLMCKYCHNRLLSASAKMDEFAHNVAQGEAGPDCVSCHDIGRSDAADVDVSKMNTSASPSPIHRRLNNQTGDPGFSDTTYTGNNDSKRCWACHSNGSQPSNVSMGLNYITPWLCYDCHTNTTAGINTSTLKGNYSAPGIFSHIPSNAMDDYSSTYQTNITTTVQCWICHNNSVAATNDTEPGPVLGHSAKSNVSHYGITTFLVSNSGQNCTYCHVQPDSSIRAKWGTNVSLSAWPTTNVSFRGRIRHETNVSHCKNCHGNLSSSITFHSDQLAKDISVHYAFDWEGDDAEAGNPPPYPNRQESCPACHEAMTFEPAGNPPKICEDCHLPTGTGPYDYVDFGPAGQDFFDYNLRSDLSGWNISDREALGIPVIYSHVPYNSIWNESDVQVKRNLSGETGETGMKTQSSCFSWNPSTNNGTCHGVSYAARFSATPPEDVALGKGYFMHYGEKEYGAGGVGSGYFNVTYMNTYIPDYAPNTSDCLFCHNQSNTSVRRFWGNAMQIKYNSTGDYDPSAMYNANTSSDCWTCHVDTRSQPKTFHIKEINPGTDCAYCHFNYTRMNIYGKPLKWVNETMFNASVHGNRSVLFCQNCHTLTEGHPPPEARWHWCEDCHVVMPTYANGSPNKNVQQRHNMTFQPQYNMINVSGTMTSVINVTDCTLCHDTAAYQQSKSIFNKTSGKNCRYCHSFPDLSIDSPY